MNQDPLLNEAKKYILETQLVSVAELQRRLRIGFHHGIKIMEQLEQEGFLEKENALPRWKIKEK